MYYSIQKSLSKEENLELAKLHEDKAKEYLKQFKELLASINKDFPVRTFGLSKSKLEKMKSPNETYDRLVSASKSYSYTQTWYDQQDRRIQELDEKEKQEKLMKQRELEKTDLLNKAIEFCLNNGLQFGIHFSTENAISVANDVAFKKQVEVHKSEIGNGYIYFSGQNCEDECSGWNPMDNRCQCGNRRVAWATVSDFRDMEIYAEAY